MVLTDISLLTTSPGALKRRPDGAAYHDGETIITHLNYALGPSRWDWAELDRGYDELADEVWVLGALTARIVLAGPDGGDLVETTTKTERGWQAVNRRRDGSLVSLGSDYKAADTDALKRAARLLGVGLDAWAKAPAPAANGRPAPRPEPAPAPVTVPVEPLSSTARADLASRYVDLLARATDAGFRASWTSADHRAWSDVQLGKYCSLLENSLARQEGGA